MNPRHEGTLDTEWLMLISTASTDKIDQWPKTAKLLSDITTDDLWKVQSLIEIEIQTRDEEYMNQFNDEFDLDDNIGNR